jgi:ABC-2 type transport system ATP-binding protein
MGLVRADQGQVNVLGRDLPDQQAIAKLDIGFASEDMRLYKSQSLRWHMDFIRKIFPVWDEAYAQKLLKVFDLKEDQNLKGFSHGQRVKANILLLLARKSKLVILDEPTAGLDPVARRDVLEEMSYILRDEERSVLFSSHNTHDIEQISDSISFLHSGRLIASQDKESFLESWRSIRCHGEVSSNDLKIDGLAEIRTNGNLIKLSMDNYDDSKLEAIKACGLKIDVVERMSLEEIFIANVMRGVNDEN